MARELSAAARAIVENAHAALDGVTYYELLGIKKVSTRTEIQSAFDRFTVELHPDLYLGLEDTEMLERLREVYGRIAEAYRVLIDGDLRVAYHRALHDGKKRLSASDISAARMAARRKDD